MVNFNLLLQNVIGDESKKKKFVDGVVGLLYLSFAVTFVPEGTLKNILYLIISIGQLTLFIWLVSKIIKYTLKKQNQKK